MDITFASKKQEKTLNSEKAILKAYGRDLGKKIQMRLFVLRVAPTLADVSHQPPEKRHELSGKRKGQFALTLKEPYRLTFVPNHDPIPMKEDGGFNLNQITAIKIIDVEDYH